MIVSFNEDTFKHGLGNMNKTKKLPFHSVKDTKNLNRVWGKRREIRWCRMTQSTFALPRATQSTPCKNRLTITERLTGSCRSLNSKLGRRTTWKWIIQENLSSKTSGQDSVTPAAKARRSKKSTNFKSCDRVVDRVGSAPRVQEFESCSLKKNSCRSKICWMRPHSEKLEFTKVIIA